MHLYHSNMSETGGLDIGMPDEGTGGVSEQASEQAQQRFAASQQAAKQQVKEEKKAKKRDDNVAQVIVQFLTDTQRTHLATLIAQLVALNCPTTFILAVLSLINDKCLTAVDDYLKEKNIDTSADPSSGNALVSADSALTDAANERIAQWIMRMELILAVDGEQVLESLIVDDQNIDGTILQLNTFVLQEFLTEQSKNVEFDALQRLSANILQSLFTPGMHARMERMLTEETPVEED